jgi:hypothetical protein
MPRIVSRIQSETRHSEPNSHESTTGHTVTRKPSNDDNFQTPFRIGLRAMQGLDSTTADPASSDRPYISELSMLALDGNEANIVSWTFAEGTALYCEECRSTYLFHDHGHRVAGGPTLN